MSMGLLAYNANCMGVNDPEYKKVCKPPMVEYQGSKGLKYAMDRDGYEVFEIKDVRYKYKGHWDNIGRKWSWFDRLSNRILNPHSLQYLFNNTPNTARYKVLVMPFKGKKRLVIYAPMDDKVFAVVPPGFSNTEWVKDTSGRVGRELKRSGTKVWKELGRGGRKFMEFMSNL